MTIPNETQKVQANGNGSATVFSFAPMIIFANTDLQVIKRDAEGEETTLSEGAGTSNYSISVSEYPGTGSITYPASGSGHLATGESVTMYRMLDLVQETDLENQGGYFPDTLEAALDYGIAVDQQLQDQLDRALVFSVTDENPSTTLPNSTERANQLLGFSSDGSPVAAQPSSALVSTAMQPVVSASTVAIARMLLGIEWATQTRAAMVSISVPSSVMIIRTTGYYTVGDGGEAIYERLGSAPSYEYFQSADGAYWGYLFTGEINIKQFGCKGDDTTDDTAKFQAALDAGLRIYIPDGRYKVTLPLALRTGHFVFGGGRGAVVNLFHTGFAFSKTGASTTNAGGQTTIRDLTIYGTSAGNGISFTLQNRTLTENVVFEGLVSNVTIDRGRNHVISNCYSIPNSLRVAGNLNLVSTSDSDYVFYPNVDNYQVYTGLFDAGNVVEGAISPCVYVRRAVCAYIKNFNADHLEIDAGISGIHFENDCQGCKIIGGSTHGAYVGVLMTEGSGVNVSPSYIEMISHDVDAFTGAGISIAGDGNVCANITISGGQITNPMSAGVPCISMSKVINATVSSVTMLRYDSGASGIGLQFADTDGLSAFGNHIYKMTTGVAFVGASNTSAKIFDNTVTLTTNPLAGDITSGGVGSNHVVRNRGINPINPITTPAVPATTVYIENTTGTDVIVNVYGGTNVTAGVNGVNTGITLSPGGVATGGSYFVPAGGTVGVNYDVAPTWVWTGV